MTLERNRETNLDLLRIVSMLMIVFLHSINHSGVLENAENCTAGMFFYVRFTYAMCMVCVNIYVMLSGYFMVNSKFRLHKLVAIWMEAAFYSLVLKLVFMITGKEEFSAVSLVSCFFPILTGRYWFLTIYVGMYLVSPFLNILVGAMNRKQHGLLNACLFAIMSVWVSIHPAIAGMNSGGGWGLSWFVVLYLTAAWLRLYYEKKKNGVWWLALFVVIPVLMAAGQLASKVLGIGILRTVTGNWFRYDSAPVYIMTLCLFVGFLNVKLSGGRLAKMVVAVAPLTLGVYLLHDHPNVQQWSWGGLNLPAKMDSAAFPLVQAALVIGIFVCCATMDAVRKATIGKLENHSAVKALCAQVSETAMKILEYVI